eukprot:TRINITY_DN11530_c0_g1_i2.p1 TRINITY_DN11530_c0_g1~~TRINITY_DN11530_c0_g1_i2.p1  ORF type:complete len:439 (+),score=123.22 TRINITY_DN11530_c0_g1_i2:821-2137(+)
MRETTTSSVGPSSLLPLLLPLRSFAQSETPSAVGAKTEIKARRKYTDPTGKSPLEGEEEGSNLTAGIRAKTSAGLLHRPNHPLAMLKDSIFQHFAPRQFHTYDDLDPVVKVSENFDDLLTPPDHPSRRPDESYFLSPSSLLRCHMTAHQRLLLDRHYDPRRPPGREVGVLSAGDVYRRDTVDATHYPVFHQLDALCLFDRSLLPDDPAAALLFVENDLKTTLEGLARKVFGENAPIRWIDAYFPFTHPSWEMEVFFNGQWLEVLGSGCVHTKLLERVNGPEYGEKKTQGWAFGLGLERWAMVLYDIPDIRLFWTDNPKFLDQFGPNKPNRFSPYSKFPPCPKDLAFWTSSSSSSSPSSSGRLPFTDNTLFELARETAGDLVENVECIDEFVHPKTGRTSKCFRITYRSMDRSLTNEEVNSLQTRLRDSLSSSYDVELR